MGAHPTGWAFLLRQAPAPDANVLLQINSRLQAVLEDLITKNTRLQVRSRRSCCTRVARPSPTCNAKVSPALRQARVDQLEKGFGDAGQPSPRA